MTGSFWDALDSIPGLLAARGEWRKRLGDLFPRASHFLKPTGKLAESLPGEHGEFLRVVRHGPEDFVGVSPSGGPPVPLDREDLLLLEVRQKNLAKVLTILKRKVAP